MNYYLLIILIILIGIICLRNYNKSEYLTLEQIKKIDENTIWTYWDQGIDKITPFYKLCLDTWKNKNPNHKIIVVDKYNVYDFLDKTDIPPKWENIEKIQHKSDFVRLALLEKYGGIWMDISTICIRPINSMFKQEKSLEGFAVRSNSSNNDLTAFENGFITAKKGSKIIKRWKEEFLKAFGNSVSVEEMDKTYFNDVDFQKLPLEWYLTMHRVLMKLIQFDPEIKYLYFNDSKILEAYDTMWIHYAYFGWMSGLKELLGTNDELMNKIVSSNTPILKLCFSGGYLKNLSKDQLLSNKDSVIYKLLKF